MLWQKSLNRCYVTTTKNAQIYKIPSKLDVHKRTLSHGSSPALRNPWITNTTFETCNNDSIFAKANVTFVYNCRPRNTIASFGSGGIDEWTRFGNLSSLLWYHKSSINRLKWRYEHDNFNPFKSREKSKAESQYRCGRVCTGQGRPTPIQTQRPQLRTQTFTKSI